MLYVRESGLKWIGVDREGLSHLFRHPLTSLPYTPHEDVRSEEGESQRLAVDRFLELRANGWPSTDSWN